MKSTSRVERRRAKRLQIRSQALLNHAFYFLFKITSSAKSMKGTEGNLDIFCKCQELDEPRQVHIKGWSCNHEFIMELTCQMV